jgi:tricorn protease
MKGYLRHPTLRGDTIAFVCDDDLWAVGADGGLARRLTAGLGEPGYPAYSPDGRWLAYVGRDEKHPEVTLMPAEGGPARRMTWLGPDVIVRGWTPEGRILFVTTHGQPFFRNYRAYTLGIDGGLPELLPYGQVNHLAYGPGGAKLIGRNTADPARWKRYRGGTCGHLWIDAEGSGEFRRMSELAGNITSPMWIGDRVWFLSDSEGVGNLYSCLPDGRDLRRHTDHDDYYARHASTDGARIVYQCGADVWLFDPATDLARRVDVAVPAHRTQAARRFVDASDFLDGFTVHPDGHSLALESRGKLFGFALWEGAVSQHGAADGVRYRLGQWLADGRTLVAVTDEPGEERLEVFAEEQAPWWAEQPADPDAAGRDAREPEAPRGGILDADIGRVLAMVAAPEGNRVALTNHRNEVIVADLDARTVRVVDRSEHGRSEEIAWSADGEWIAYPFATDTRHSAIKLCEVATGRTCLASTPEFRDYAPAFDPEGRYLYFLSYRTFDPVYDSVQFELSFPRGARPYLVALQAGGLPPFEPIPEGLGAKEDDDEGDDRDDHDRKDPEDRAGSGDGNDAPEPIRIDLDGIERRVAAFPVPEGLYRQIAGIEGKVLWSVFPIAGAHGRGGHKDETGRLECFDLESMQCETVVDSVETFAIAHDGKTLVFLDDERLRAIEAGKKPDDKHDDEEPPKYSRKSGWIDLDRVRVSVDPRREWRQMLREVWRLQRDQFWVADMSGVDWEAAYRRYEPLLERVATRGEFSDLVWELQGELGTSHAYESHGDYREPPPLELGQLGADFRWDDSARGWRIEHLVAGDPWETGADSPLGAVGVEAREGEVVLAVNGRRLDRGTPPQALLVHQAGCRAELVLASPDGASRRTVLVTLAESEVPARYREWVEANRRRVHERSGGRVGYLHLPDMQSAGFAEFHRYFTSECDRDALIVDVRYNRGGHVSQLLLEKLARRRIGYDLQRWGAPVPYPGESPAGALVALTNEHAGSDGDIFSHCFKLMRLGPLVGKRTWGGVIGIWPRHALVDGTETTQPEFSFWSVDVGWALENYGTDPDVDVDNAPQDHASGRDRQLETALAIALERLAAHPPLRPPFDARPVLAAKGLPPRPGGREPVRGR